MDEEYVLCKLRLWNLNTAAAGSIRKAPNAISFVYASITVGDKDFVKTWNTKCAASDRLAGRKAQCVRTLLDLKPAHLKQLNDVVSRFGWDGNLDS